MNFMQEMVYEVKQQMLQGTYVKGFKGVKGPRRGRGREEGRKGGRGAQLSRPSNQPTYRTYRLCSCSLSPPPFLYPSTPPP